MDIRSHPNYTLYLATIHCVNGFNFRVFNTILAMQLIFGLSLRTLVLRRLIMNDGRSILRVKLFHVVYYFVVNKKT